AGDAGNLPALSAAPAFFFAATTALFTGQFDVRPVKRRVFIEHAVAVVSALAIALVERGHDLTESVTHARLAELGPESRGQALLPPCPERPANFPLPMPQLPPFHLAEAPKRIGLIRKAPEHPRDCGLLLREFDEGIRARHDLHDRRDLLGGLADLLLLRRRKLAQLFGQFFGLLRTKLAVLERLLQLLFRRADLRLLRAKAFAE